MPRLGPISRRDLIANLRRLGFSGPYSGGNHQYMIRDTVRVWIPNLHRGDISRQLLERTLRQAGILREEWGSL